MRKLIFLLKFLLPAQRARQTLTAFSIPLSSSFPSPKRTCSALLQVTTCYRINRESPISCHRYAWQTIAFRVLSPIDKRQLYEDNSMTYFSPENSEMMFFTFSIPAI